VPCVIVFGGDDQELLTLRLDVDADEVAKSLRGHSIQRIEVKGRAVWVNPQNVLYVEDASAPSPADEQAVSLPDVS
jgi:ABC-type arginine transport system ATPase subunit